MKVTNDEEITLLQNQILDQKDKVKEAMSMKVSLNEDLSRLQTECHELRKELSIKSSELQTIKSDCDQKSDKISSMTEKLSSIEDENITLCSELERMKKEAEIENNVQLQNVSAKLISLQKEYDVIQEKLDNESKNHITTKRKLTTLRSEVEENKMELDIERQKLSDAYKELQTKEEVVRESRESLANDTRDEKILSLEAEIHELKELLASAIKREEEARSIAIAADEELEIKEREHEEMEKLAAERGAYAKELEQEILKLERDSSSTSSKEIEELENELELILEQKDALEKQRSNDALRHAQAVKDLEHQAGEEQRALVHQGETRIQKLRDELNETKLKMKKFEDDAKISRQELAQIENNIKNEKQLIEDLKASKSIAEEHLIQANQASTNLSLQLKKIQNEYDEYRNHEKQMKDAMKLTYEKKLASTKEELHEVRASYFNEEAKTKDVLRNNTKYEDEINRLHHDLKSMDVHINEKSCEVSKLKEEIATVRVQLSRTEAENFECKQAFEQNKERLKKYKEKSKGEMLEATKHLKSALSQHEQALIENGKKNEMLQAENAELKDKLKSKEARMKNLETKRLTKDQVAEIKKVMVSFIVYKNGIDRKMTSNDGFFP